MRALMFKNKGKFICITGIDGSGKSTQAELLVSNCKKNGIPIRYVYAKTKPIFFKPVLIIAHYLVLRNYHENEKYSEYKEKKQSVIEKHKFFSSFFYKIMIIDYQIQLFVKVSLPLYFGRNIVCDRYIFDTIITDIAVDQKYTLDDVIVSIDKLWKKNPRPDLIFLIDVSEEIAFKRKTDVVSIDYLKERRETYLAIAHRYGMIIIDGKDPLETIESRIYQDVAHLFGGDQCLK
jgi:dTMP kinase